MSTCNWLDLEALGSPLRASSTLIGGKRRSRSKFALHYARGTNGVSECKMDVKWMQGFLQGIKWIMFHSHLDYFQKPPLGGRSNTKPVDQCTPNAHNRWFILFRRAWGPPWINNHWNSIWLKAHHIWLHTTLEDPWPHYMILEVCWDGLGHYLLGSHIFMVMAFGSWPRLGPQISLGTDVAYFHMP